MPSSTCITCGHRIPIGKYRCGEHNLRKRRSWSTYRRARREFLSAHPQCARCGHTGSADNPLTLDHVMPLSRGGADDVSNWQTLCAKHNRAKSDRV